MLARLGVEVGDRFDEWIVVRAPDVTKDGDRCCCFVASATERDRLGAAWLFPPEHPALASRIARAHAVRSFGECRYLRTILGAGYLPNGFGYLVQELTQATPVALMHDFGPRRRPLTPEMFLRWEYACMLGLLHLHENGFVHQHVHPMLIWHRNGGDVGDVFLENYCDPWNADIRRRLAANPDRRRYLSPQLLDGAPPTDKDDVYAMGMVGKALARHVGARADGNRRQRRAARRKG